MDETKELEMTVVDKQPTTPATILEMAVARDVPIETLERLMEMQIKWESNEAMKAYHKAMAAFKADPPKIVKDKHVQYKTNAGMTDYMHSSLFAIVEAISQGLSKHGLSASWRTEQTEGMVTVTCTITHELGYSESTSLTAAPDSSGGKNQIQAVGSSVSYLSRYTLMAITGLASADMDDDGAGGKKPEVEDKPITAGQVKKMRTQCEKVANGEERLIKYINDPDIDKLEKIPRSRFDNLMELLKEQAKLTLNNTGESDA